MKAKIIYIILAMMVFAGCWHNYVEPSGIYRANPAPRKPVFMRAIALSGIDYSTGVFLDNPAKIDKLWILVVTHNNPIDKNGEYDNREDPIDEGFARIDKVVRKMKSGFLGSGEYRTEGMKSFRIFSPDAILFGISAGEPLNDFFNLTLDICGRDDEVHFIATMDPSPKVLQVCHFSDVSGVPDMKHPGLGEYYTIQEWMALKPLVAPSMLLKFKSPPADQPVTFTLTVEVVTSTGRVLTSTTEPMTVTP